MNHKERILAAVQHQPVDRLPTDMWATPEVMQKLMDYFKVKETIDVYDKLDIDGIIHISPPYIGPATKKEEDYFENEWGMGMRKQPYNTGAYDEQILYPLAGAETIADLEAYTFPSPDWYDYTELPRIAALYPDRAIEVGYTAVFYYHNLLRGLELSLMDLALRPEFSHYLIGRLSDFFNEFHRRCYEACKGVANFTQVTDDYGAQFGLMISPKTFETFYRPAMQRAINLAKSYGLFVFHHDDGDCRKLIPSLIEMGIDILNPIQWRCGNWDLPDLKSRYGQQLCFHSAVDNQKTIPFGTPEDVRAEIRHLISTLGSDHTGFIIAPCHNLQPVTPIENIIALYEETNKRG
jgi:uroporphyrinogen decarboxylase